MIIINYQNGRVALHFNDIAAVEQRGFSVDLLTYNHGRYHLFQSKDLESVDQIFDDAVKDLINVQVHGVIYIPHPSPLR